MGMTQPTKPQKTEYSWDFFFQNSINLADSQNGEISTSRRVGNIDTILCVFCERLLHLGVWDHATPVYADVPMYCVCSVFSMDLPDLL